ncbi:hypothetical protein ACN4EK_06595 [Pantanalinema rosaneae CENA516]|uniref:hypothetical protein n=1 Tax=Pantanalinema rosaneae TaxID=1620701 RepID=UPI003D6F7DB6
MALKLGQICSLVGIAAAGILVMQLPAIAEYEHGPINRGGCFNIGDEKIKFVAQVVSTNVDSDLRRISSSISSACNGTHVWDDKWYHWTLPDNRPKYLLLTWKNSTTGEYGYAFIQNTPKHWWYKTNDAGFKTIANDEQKKLTWWSNGHRIDIDLKNPKNTNRWTANDIWYSFGY